MVTSAQSSATVSTPAELLLVEVRGLRSDVNQLSSISVRSQLLVARLQLQEQRIAAASRLLNEVRTALATARDELAERQVRFDRWDEQLRTAGGAQRARLESIAPNPKVALDRARQREQELTREENDLLMGIATDQDRWTYFNDRLDEIERTLPAR